MKVVYSPAAQDDVKDIFNYIAYELQAPQAARNQVNRIRSAIKKLNSMPERHEVVSWEPWASMGMRRKNSFDTTPPSLGKLKIARRNAGGEHCMQQAARQAVGHHSPKGGDVYAYYVDIPYWRIHVHHYN